MPWLRVEFDGTDRTARRFMQVAEAFGDKSDTVSNWEAKALYLLSAPSTPDSAREEAIKRAGSGEEITHSKAAEIVTTHKLVQPPPDPPEEPGPQPDLFADTPDANVDEDLGEEQDDDAEPEADDQPAKPARLPALSRSAARFMQVAESFGGRSCQFGNFAPAALCLLAAPSAPDKPQIAVLPPSAHQLPIRPARKPSSEPSRGDVDVEQWTAELGDFLDRKKDFYCTVTERVRHGPRTGQHADHRGIPFPLALQ